VLSLSEASDSIMLYVCILQLKTMVPIDLLFGGSPCNDFSIANPLRQGLDGKLPFLWINIVKTK